MDVGPGPVFFTIIACQIMRLMTAVDYLGHGRGNQEQWRPSNHLDFQGVLLGLIYSRYVACMLRDAEPANR
ncbi:MAG: hypothetical protein LBP92_03160 [Deltaproteobacteria bacterium]|jgi:hypothetical protein|nr:hypothetical protein [Deltaproteobacteria bacterium]